MAVAKVSGWLLRQVLKTKLVAMCKCIAFGTHNTEASTAAICFKQWSYLPGLMKRCANVGVHKIFDRN